MSNLPNGISKFFSPWSPARKGISIVESLTIESYGNGSEEWIGTWDGVGLYEGNADKVQGYQTLSVHLTTHRLILVPVPVTESSSSNPHPSPSSISLQVALSYIRQTEFYTGFMRSSPKITLFLGSPISASTRPDGTSPSNGSNTNNSNPSWTCRVCGYVNGSQNKCGLCGVSRDNAVQSQPSSTNALNSISGSSHSYSVSVTPTATASRAQIACPACTFLNSHLLLNCEICSTPLPRTQSQQPSPSLQGNNSTSNLNSIGNVSESGKMDIIRLSFRKGGEKEAYKKLKSVLGSKAWERQSNAMIRNRGKDDGGGVDGLPPSRSSAGIDGILQSIDLSAKNEEAHMRSAFEDLEVLMIRAGEMVKLAQSLNSKLTQQQSSSGVGGVKEEEVSMIRNSLVQLGLAAPALTKDMVKSQNDYLKGLAKELGELLTGRDTHVSGERTKQGLMLGKEGRGVIGLDEVWGLWMRARGVALLPPSTLIDILPYIPSHTKPSINSLTLPSGLLVLHTPHYSTLSTLERTIDRLSTTDTEVQGSISLIEFASYEGLALALAKELLESIELVEGGLVRDDQAGANTVGAAAEAGGTRWYRDLISSYPISQI